MAKLLHQLAPDGDVRAAALALSQVSLDASCQLGLLSAWKQRAGQDLNFTQSPACCCQGTIQDTARKIRSNVAELCLHVYSTVPKVHKTQKHEVVNLVAVLFSIA